MAWAHAFKSCFRAWKGGDPIWGPPGEPWDGTKTFRGQNFTCENLGPRTSQPHKPSRSKSVSLFQVGVVGEGEEWLLVHQLTNEPDARSMEVPELNPFTYYR